MGVLICFLLALLIAFLVIGILKSQLKSVAKKTQADHYAGPDALTLTGREDVFTHCTRTRTYSPREKKKN